MLCSLRASVLSKLKYFLFLSICIAVASCGGGGGGGGTPQPDGEVLLEPMFTISGEIGEQVSGTGEVTIYIGQEAYTATLSENRFTVEVPEDLSDALVVVRSVHRNTTIGETIVLKSYAGTLNNLRSRSSSDSVNEESVPALYLSAAGTAVSAFLEKISGGEITSEEELINASQTLPQALIVESAIVLKSIFAGDTWGNFSQPDTYALLQEHPRAIEIAAELEASKPDSYNMYKAEVISNQNQFLAQNFSPEEELIFIETNPWAIRPSGFALQLPAANGDTGYYADAFTHKSMDNSTSIYSNTNSISISKDGFWPTRDFFDEREACVVGDENSYTATAIRLKLTKYLETPVFSAYTTEMEYRCDETQATFFEQLTYAQLNKRKYGDFESFTSGIFAIGSYIEHDPETHSTPFSWQAVIVAPNASGGITQLFDIKSGYSDDGSLAYLSPSHMWLGMNRGDVIEYFASGTEGNALKTVALAKRDDGSVASVGGGYVVPFTQGITIPLPSKIAFKNSVLFSGVSNSKYDTSSFGFEFVNDGVGYHLTKTDDGYQRTTGFQWFEKSGYLDLRYFYHRTDTSNPLPIKCEEGDADCVEYRFREIEPLAQIGSDYFLRIYQEADFSKFDSDGGKEISVSSYIERFSLIPQ